MEGQVSIASKTLQLESYQLDCEFQKVIDHTVDNINLQSVSEEAKLLLKFYINSHLLKNGETVGSKIYKLNYVDASSPELMVKPKFNNVVLLNALHIILPYLVRRKETIRTNLLKVLGTHEVSSLDADYPILLTKAMGVVNFFMFLFGGKYLSLAERISRIVPVISDRDCSTSLAINRVQMDLLNREVVWKELASFITTVIPYIQTERMRYKLLHMLGNFGLGAKRGTSGDYKDLGYQIDVHRCGICENQPFNPYSIGCRHIFCYYCQQSRHLLDPEAGYSCTKCNYVTANVSEFRRHKVFNYSESYNK